MHRRFVLAATIAWINALGICAPAVAEGWQPELMDRQTEMREALAAGPESIREGAGVYLLTAEGYRLDRPSSNGFHCVVGRSQPESFEPQCLDAEGSRTLLEQILLRGELQMAGHSAAEIAEELDRAWADGRLAAPQRPGINYMLHPENRVPVGPDRVVPYGAHLMFFAPGLTDADIGGDRTGRTSPIFMINPGTPSGYVIVPVHEHE